MDEPAQSLTRTLGLATSWQVQAEWSFASTTQAMHYCMADDRVLTDLDRATTCDLLARLLADAPDSPIDSATARTIGIRLGWPAERLEALAKRSETSGAIVRQRRLGADLSCRDVETAEASLRAALSPRSP